MLASRFLRYTKSHVRYVSAKATIINETVSKFNEEIRNGGIVPAFKLAALFDNRHAIQDQAGEVTYRGLFEAAQGLSHHIIDKLNGERQKTVAYLCPGDTTHVFTLWAIWMTGNIAIPLSPQHPPALIEYFLKDSGASLLICDSSLSAKVANLSAPTLDIPPTIRSSALINTSSESSEQPFAPLNLDEFPNGKFYADSDALILYTSGTTSNPKGVVHGFKQLAYQIASLHNSWRYRANDTLLHCLPLNHIHGLVASVCAGLAAGAKIRMTSPFLPANIWAHFLGMKKRGDSRITVFMGVPTMYAKLLEEYDRVFVSNKHQEYVKNVMMQKMRLMISGSAPLPNSVFERWEEITGHKLLERYGMTETGLALSNPYEPALERTPGYVGSPLPGISIKIGDSIVLEGPPVNLEINLSALQLDPDKNTPINLFVEEDDAPLFNRTCKVTYKDDDVDTKIPIKGDLFMKGPTVMNRYWNRPEQTKADLTDDGWFKTGDSVIFETGKIKVIGRTSVDLIKSGGYRVSALEVEAAIFGHPSIADAIVLGLPDPTWGEKVTAVVQLKEGTKLTLQDLQEYGSEFIPKYQLPTSLFLMPKIPRNAMGKANKLEIRQILIKQNK